MDRDIIEPNGSYIATGYEYLFNINFYIVHYCYHAALMITEIQSKLVIRTNTSRFVVEQGIEIIFSKEDNKI